MHGVFSPFMEKEAERSFREDVFFGLSSQPKFLSCKFFYDEIGSRLFERICELPEYYVTRTELEIMEHFGDAIAAKIGRNAHIVELGSGAGIKTKRLLSRLEQPSIYTPVDISREHLLETAEGFRRDFPTLTVRPIAADFTRGFELPPIEENADGPQAEVRDPIVYFPGSTIGNFQPHESRRLLQTVSNFIGDEGGLLLGFDRIKSPSELQAAYDDASGVTAAFNLNLLARINRELGGTFDLERFEHQARWNPEDARIEIYIRSSSDQRVTIGERSFEFKAGEEIHTENSHKYTEQSMQALAEDAGLALEEHWTDPAERFSVGLLSASPELTLCAFHSTKMAVFFFPQKCLTAPTV